MSWPTVPLSSAFEFIRNGMSVKQDSGAGGLPITRIETISDGTVNPRKVGFAGLGYPEATRWMLEKGDILFSHINSFEHVGKCAVYRGEPAELVHGMNLLCFRADRAKLNPEYAKHLLRSRGFRAQLERFINKAVNQASVSIGNLSDIPVTLPPLDEQQRIANMLDKAEELRAKRRAAITLLDQLPQAIFLDMFGDPKTNSMNLAKLPIGSLANIKTGGTPSRTREDNYGGDIPWVKTGEVTGHPIRSTEESLTEKGLKGSNCQLFPVGSVVIAMYGQGKTRGRCSVLEIEATTNQACAVVLPSSQLSSSFLFEQLNMSYEQLRQMGRGGNQPNLNLSLVSGFEVLVPPKEQQEHFAVRVEAIHRAKADQQSALIELDALFAALQGSSFQGAKG